MVTNKFDVAVIGAGIIGLSTAMNLLEQFPKLKIGVIEKDSQVAAQQSGHNSGVIHSGIYYKPGSFKARFCVEGRASMTRFCEENEIPFDRCGKLIIATREADLPRLEGLYERGTSNKVEGLELVGPERISEIEPHVKAMKALYAPYTSIVDFRNVAAVYAERIKTGGGSIELNAQLRQVVRKGGSTILETPRGEFETKHVINCAGLHSDTVATMMGARPDVRIIPFRGEYYTLRKDREHLVNGLIYPTPDPAFPFLGVHFTKNMKGYTEAGPNAVLATAREGYRKRDFRPGDFVGTMTYPGFWGMALRDWKTGFMEINRSLRKGVFVKDLQKMIPEIKKEDLAAGGSGVRAQAVDRHGKLLDDFRIDQTENAVHVLNAPSPGATSSLVIGAYISEMAVKTFSLS
ncbi:MAG: L-2-hydroxyglutarate oxidase [Dehalococcoidia bacterium]